MFGWFIVTAVMHIRKVSCMLEEFHAKPMKINCNNTDRKCQWHQEAVISAIIRKDREKLEQRMRSRIWWNYLECYRMYNKSILQGPKELESNSFLVKWRKLNTVIYTTIQAIKEKKIFISIVLYNSSVVNSFNSIWHIVLKTWVRLRLKKFFYTLLLLTLKKWNFFY